MAINNNIYQNGYIINYDEGDQSLQRAKGTYTKQDGDTIHIWRDGDMLTAMALKYYGNPRLWYYIGDANNIFIPFPDDIQIGSQLVIPNIGNNTK